MQDFNAFDFFFKHLSEPESQSLWEKIQFCQRLALLFIAHILPMYWLTYLHFSFLCLMVSSSFLTAGPFWELGHSTFVP